MQPQPFNSNILLEAGRGCKCNSCHVRIFFPLQLKCKKKKWPPPPVLIPTYLKLFPQESLQGSGGSGPDNRVRGASAGLAIRTLVQVSCLLLAPVGFPLSSRAGLRNFRKSLKVFVWDEANMEEELGKEGRK